MPGPKGTPIDQILRSFTDAGELDLTAVDIVDIVKAEFLSRFEKGTIDRRLLRLSSHAES